MTRTRRKTRKPSTHLLNQVFNLAELREMIIGRAIYTQAGNKAVPCRPTIKALRLVSKDWLLAVSKTLSKDKVPLFQLKLDNKTNSPTDEPNPEKLLDQFVKSFCSNSWNQKQTPTFRLIITETFFRLENYSSLRDCLVKCGKGLLSLRIFPPLGSSNLPCLFPQFVLPILKELILKYCSNSVAGHGEFAPNTVALATVEATHFINTILNSTTSLQTIQVHNNLSGNDSLPANLQFLSLPSTINSFVFQDLPSSVALELFGNNQLPNLNQLIFHPLEESCTDGTVLKILEGLGNTLSILKIAHFKGLWAEPKYIRFPVMKNLQELHVFSHQLILEAESNSMEICFPKLNKLNFLQSTEGLKKWTEKSTFNGVHTLELFVLNRRSIATLNLESMQLLHRAFPNLSHLNLSCLSGAQTCGLKYLFMEMKQLISLDLVICGSGLETNLDYWDALLTGIPEDLVRGVRSNPDLWDKIAFANESIPSIVMLKELQSLSLIEKGVSRSENEAQNQPLISDVSFQYAFFKMPKLQMLNLHGRFKASEAMENAWKVKNKSVECFDNSDSWYNLFEFEFI